MNYDDNGNNNNGDVNYILPGQSSYTGPKAPSQAINAESTQPAQYNPNAYAGNANSYSGTTYTDNASSSQGSAYSGSTAGSTGTAYSGNTSSSTGSSFKEEKQYKRSEVVVLKKSTVSLITVIAVVVFIASAIGGGFFVTGVNSLRTVGGEAPIQSNTYSIQPTSDMGTTEAVAKKVLNSVVGITTTAQSSNFFGQGYDATGQGTGMIVHADGYILTNSHVISDGAATTIEVLLADGKSVEAKTLWYDETIDLAIIKIDLQGLSPVEIGDSDNLQIGAYVAAIGNPLGLEFNGSVTQGIISGLNRSIVASSDTKTSRMEGLIQVDAAINPGNSGGPLLNSKGEVIGVNTAKASAEGMGFAIPINTAAPIIEKVIATGSFQRPYMGVTTMNASEIANQYPDLQINVEKGAFVTEVASGSPSDKAGLKMYDVITALNGKAIESSSNLIKELLNYSVGESVDVTYIRQGVESKTKVTLSTQAEIYGDSNNQNQNPQEGSQNPENQPDEGNPYRDNPYYENPNGEDPYGDDWNEEDFWERFFGR